MKEKVINDAMNSIETRLRHVYNQGFEEGHDVGLTDSMKVDKDVYSQGYKQGLDDAWECARKILFDSSLPRDILTELGADSFSGVIHKCSASEVIEKLKEYEERKKQTKRDCKTCIHSNIGKINSTEVCHECIAFESQYEAFSKQTEEKTDKSCESCRFVDLEENEFPCSCCSKAYGLRWQLKEGES